MTKRVDGPLILTELDPTHDPRWDEFVSVHPSATVYHHSAWTRVLAETYGHRPLFVGLLSADGKELKGVLPLIYVKSVLTGRRLVSLPFTAYSNPMLPEEYWDAAVGFAKQRYPEAKYVEFRMIRPLGAPAETEPAGANTPFVCSILSLQGSLEDILRSFHPSCIQRQIRRAEKAGLIFRVADREEDVRRLYWLFVSMRRREGLPCPAYKFFASMHRSLTPHNLYQLAVVEHEREVLAAALMLKSKSTWHIEYNASHPDLPLKGANQLLMWKLITQAHAAGIGYFDFGRTALWQESLLVYKERWQAARYPIRLRVFPEPAEPPKWSMRSRHVLLRVNRKLPAVFLKWAGPIIYPHRD